MQPEKKQEFEELVLQGKASVKIFLQLSPLVGFVFLNGYLAHFGASFPIELESLPVLLLSVGVISIMFVAMFSIIVVLGGAYNIDPWGVQHYSLLYSSAQQLDRKKINSIATRHLLVSHLIPFLIALAVFLWVSLHWQAMILEIVIIFSFWAICYSFWLANKSTGSVQRNRILLRGPVHIALTLCFSFCIFLALAALIFGVLGSFSDVSKWVIWWCGLAYALVNIACMFPNHAYQKTCSIIMDANGRFIENTISPAVITSKNSPLIQPWIIIVGLSIYGFTMPDISYFIGKGALRMMHIGGEINFIIRDTAENCAAWPDYIKAPAATPPDPANKEQAEPAYCTSKVGKLILKLSDRAYVIFEDEKGVLHLEDLNIENASMENRLPLRSLYVKRHAQKSSASSAASR